MTQPLKARLPTKSTGTTPDEQDGRRLSPLFSPLFLCPPSPSLPFPFLHFLIGTELGSLIMLNGQSITLASAGPISNTWPVYKSDWDIVYKYKSPFCLWFLDTGTYTCGAGCPRTRDNPSPSASWGLWLWSWATAPGWQSPFKVTCVSLQRWLSGWQNVLLQRTWVLFPSLAYDFSSRGSNALCWPQWVLDSHVHIPLPHMHTHIYRI